MFNNTITVLATILISIIAILALQLFLVKNANTKLQSDLQISKQETVKTKHTTEAVGITEKFEAIKPTINKEVHHEDINFSIGKHRIIIGD